MNILVIEDEPNVAAFIRKGLQEQSYEVDVVHDGLSGKRHALRKDYDLIILDIILPGCSGLEVCRDIRQDNPLVPILMLTALGTTDDVVTGLNAGADDYLTKPFKFKELQARVLALLRRSNLSQESSQLQVADLTMNLNAKTVHRAGREIKLTAKEFALLEYFIRNKGRVLSRIDLLENVWELNFDLNSNVVEVYVNYLRNKIDKDFDCKLLHTVIGMGYVLKEESQ
ncbi:DNA-binding response OmpR family regulator [Pontibacter aydingkolensis]|uniref:Response regulator transcription factor n=1 Tax=Pontibacter aydingkolensis TaxID=1911536 RepID=A0ABS7CVN1_9BACT|nr:response regulator transcription factor [Pontibacter aydingkolensis]MBW7467850.1 response regulator transcription factor [Pontibacter aydingkolensis]